MDTIKISAVAFEEAGVWVVQGIEFDICTHAKDAAAVPAAFMRAVLENACITQHLGRAPLQGIQPAPERFKMMFDEAVTQVSPVKDLARPHPSIAAIDIRLAGHA
jgi:hypothetical protein